MENHPSYFKRYIKCLPNVGLQPNTERLKAFVYFKAQSFYIDNYTDKDNNNSRRLF